MNPPNNPLKVYIISWPGQHQNAVFIADEITSLSVETLIVYSDSESSFFARSNHRSIQRPNNLFWEDKFKACIDSCEDAAILIIHADCECADWKQLVKSYMKASSTYDIGVWSPRISNTAYDLSVSRIAKIPNTNLHLVALTDGIIFSLAPSIINRFRKLKFGKNIYGWGLDILFCVSAHLNDLLVVIDDSINVSHRKGRGYDSRLAKQGMHEFLSTQLSTKEFIHYKLLLSYVELSHFKLRERNNAG